jgi:hypothetical protein
VLAYQPGREAELWAEYLETCRYCCELDYGEVEPWAWRRLQQELKLLARRRAA